MFVGDSRTVIKSRKFSSREILRSPVLPPISAVTGRGCSVCFSRAEGRLMDKHMRNMIDWSRKLKLSTAAYISFYLKTGDAILVRQGLDNFLCVVAHTWNPGTEKSWVKGSGIWGQPWLDSKALERWGRIFYMSGLQRQFLFLCVYILQARQFVRHLWSTILSLLILLTISNVRVSIWSVTFVMTHCIENLRVLSVWRQFPQLLL